MRFLLFLLLLLRMCLSHNSNHDRLVVIMLDGFRWDYAERAKDEELPNIRQFMREGVRAEYVQPVFPSNSFPSWTSIVTGLYPGDHGILDNNMWDRESGKSFLLGDVNKEGDQTADPIWWKDHVPLWTTATKAGIKTSLYLWSRCDVPFDGILPEKCINYDNDDCLEMMVFRSHLSSAVVDLKRDFGLVMVYNSNVDQAGHERGPDSEEVKEEIKKTDTELGYFFRALEDEGLAQSTNIVILTDHGMLYWADHEFAKLSDYLSPTEVEKAVGWKSFLNIALKDPSKADEALAKLKKWDGVKAYKKGKIPERYMLNRSERVFDIVVMSEDGDDKVLIDKDASWPEGIFVPEPNRKELAKDPNERKYAGGHGLSDLPRNISSYDEEGPMPDLRGIFMARGPAFRSGGEVVNWIKLVDEYQIFGRVLSLDHELERHRGTPGRVEPFFKGYYSSTRAKENNLIVLLFIPIFISMYFL